MRLNNHYYIQLYYALILLIYYLFCPLLSLPPSLSLSLSLPPAPGGPPQFFSITPINSTSLSLSWLPVDELLQNGIINNYTVGCNGTMPQQVCVDNNLEMTQSRYYHNVNRLTPGTLYKCYVFANTSEGNGPIAMAMARTHKEGESLLG